MTGAEPRVGPRVFLFISLGALLKHGDRPCSVPPPKVAGCVPAVFGQHSHGPWVRPRRCRLQLRGARGFRCRQGPATPWRPPWGSGSELSAPPPPGPPFHTPRPSLLRASLAAPSPRFSASTAGSPSPVPQAVARGSSERLRLLPLTKCCPCPPRPVRPGLPPPVQCSLPSLPAPHASAHPPGPQWTRSHTCLGLKGFNGFP